MGAIVLEKEKGILEYLQMNGMSQTAYNVSFVMHETLVNGPLICVILDSLIWYRLFFSKDKDLTSFFIWSILKFNLGILLFTMGTVAFIILVSKAFSKSGFATQIGSLLYLVPLFLSLYLRALDMKHRMAETANKGMMG